MEIGDLFVINKADREGAERGAFASALGARAARPPRARWDPPVLLTVASQGTGVAEVVDGFERHLAFLEEHGGLVERRRRRLEQRLADLLRDGLWTEFRHRIPTQAWQEALGCARATEADSAPVGSPVAGIRVGHASRARAHGVVSASQPRGANGSDLDPVRRAPLTSSS